MKQPGSIIILAVVAIIILGGVVMVRHHAAMARPTPNFANLHAYIDALDKSRQPEMMAIKQEVADGPAALAHEEAMARADGIPLTLAQIQPPMPPASENAAPIYTRIADLKRAAGKAESKDIAKQLPLYAWPLSYGFSYTPKQLAVVEKYIQNHRQIYSLILQAAYKPKCVYTFMIIKYAGAPSMAFPNVGVINDSARQLMTLSFLLATKRDYKQAISTQALGYNVETQAEPRLFLINMLVGLAIDSITTKGMENILYVAGPNQVVDTRVVEAIHSSTTRYDLKTALADEVPNMVLEMDGIKANPACIGQQLVNMNTGPEHLTPSDIRFTRNLIDAVEARSLALTIPVIKAADEPDRIRKPLFQQYDQLCGSDASFASKDPVTVFCALACDQGLLMLLDSKNRIQAEREVAMAAALALAAKATTGAFPAALHGHFTDPFNDKPLGYRREGTKGFVVYSVGESGTFNGGQPGQYTFKRSPIFFRYPGPPLKPVPADLLQ